MPPEEVLEADQGTLIPKDEVASLVTEIVFDLLLLRLNEYEIITMDC